MEQEDITVGEIDDFTTVTLESPAYLWGQTVSSVIDQLADVSDAWWEIKNNNDGNLQIPIMGDDVTTLFTGTLSDMTYAQLSESAYNFLFLVVKPSSGPNVLMPVLPDATSVAGTVSVYTAEAYDTYMFQATIYDNGDMLVDNRNMKFTTILGNPASVTGSSFTITNIYGICRISS